MLRELSSKFDEIIVSTGATYDQEILHAANFYRNNYAFWLNNIPVLWSNTGAGGFYRFTLEAFRWLLIAGGLGSKPHHLVDITNNLYDWRCDDARDGPVSITLTRAGLSDFFSFLQERKNAMIVIILVEGSGRKPANLATQNSPSWLLSRSFASRSGSYRGTKMIDHEETHYSLTKNLSELPVVGEVTILLTRHSARWLQCPDKWRMLV